MFVSSFISILSWLSLVSAAPLCGLVPPKQSANTTVAVSTASGNASTVDYVAAAWYAGWANSTLPPSSISWQKYTHMTFSFAVTTGDESILSLSDSYGDNLPEFVTLAHANNVSALVSIGGWTGGKFFSNYVATAENRTKFVAACVNLTQVYNLDGLDFDWEYPNKQAECNQISANDTSNYLAFLQELRLQLPSAYLTLSVGMTPFNDENANPLGNVSAFADVVDHIAIMNYDVNGLFNTVQNVGPNAPLQLSQCMNETGALSATSAVQAWTAAGIPASKIVLGVPSYGHSFFVHEQDAIVNNQIALYPPFDLQQQPFAPGEDASTNSTTDVCGNMNALGGIYTFAQMISTGFLDTTGEAASNASYLFDNCTQTPYVYSQTSQVMISYDNAQSFGAKGDFIVANGLRGFAMYDAAGDYNDILLDAISDAMLDGDCNC